MINNDKKKCIECLSTKVDTEKAIEKISTPLPPAKKNYISIMFILRPIECTSYLYNLIYYTHI